VRAKIVLASLSDLAVDLTVILAVYVPQLAHCYPLLSFDAIFIIIIV
jgi:hypothetical protein